VPPDARAQPGQRIRVPYSVARRPLPAHFLHELRDDPQGAVARQPVALRDLAHPRVICQNQGVVAPRKNQNGAVRKRQGRMPFEKPFHEQKGIGRSWEDRKALVRGPSRLLSARSMSTLASLMARSILTPQAPPQLVQWDEGE
jgi:hypothetical protein